MPDAGSNVGRYYDRNTHRFLRFGHGGEQRAIRRAVWGPGVESRSEAIEYVNRLISEELKESRAETVLDLGCGVGGSILYLARLHSARYIGATISETQALIGSRFLSESGIANAGIVHADFTSDDFEQSLDQSADVAFAVESFLHLENMVAKLARVARLIRPGGRMIVVDDMVSRAAESRSLGRRELRWLREFRTGWHAYGLVGLTEFLDGARSAGFRVIETRDLTQHLELDRSRDLAARILMAATRWSPVRPPWFENLLGGNALQLCLKNGIVRYLYSVFERV